MCGIYSLSGIFQRGDAIIIYNGPISNIHYQMRLIVSILWIDRQWSGSDNINLQLNGSTQASASFSCTNCI